MITSIHITTPLNYRRAVSVRSDFPEYHNFPEVYHAEEIIISLFSVPARRIAKKNADILFGASEQSALAIIRDHKDRFSEKYIQPLYLRKSILLVKKGNPKNIKSIDDLTRAGIGIIVNDGGGTSNTSGTGVWEDIAGRKGNIETVAAIRKNIILYAPNSGTARKAFENQPEADVWITWADWAASNPGIGDVVEIASDYVIWRDMNITVRQDANDEIRRFAEWLQTDEAAPAFKKYGWTRKGS